MITNRAGVGVQHPAIKIHRIDSRLTGEHREISAEVDGDRVYFRAPKDFDLRPTAEPFLGVALLEAMLRRVDIHIDESFPISEKLYDALPEIQRIYAAWNSDLRPIEVHARGEARTETFERVGSFYSGGVDGSFTLCRNLDDITHLIMLGGIEWEGNTEDSWQEGARKNAAFAKSIGKQILPVGTNVKEWTDKRKLHWTFVHGPILCAMGSLFGFKRVYVASTHTYNELFPWGSHPLTDPMWRTESTQVLHDGAAFRRGEKMKELCKHEHILDNLKACWHSIHENCGKCPKCIRTMTALFLLGKSTKAFPDLKYEPGVLRSFRVKSENAASFLEDALVLAQDAGHPHIARVLRRYYRHFQIRQIVKMVDKYLVGGRLRRTYRACRKPGRWRLEVIGSEDWDV